MKMTKLAMDNQMLPNNLTRGKENKIHSKNARELTGADGEVGTEALNCR